MVSDSLVVVAALADVFDGLGIPYLVGGSLAPSMASLRPVISTSASDSGLNWIL